MHGFVLAGGKSSRMGQDKALLRFRGRPMVKIAVEKLRSFCTEVSIAGNRDDLSRFAPVVPETRLGTGPGAGIEAGLLGCAQPWALFIPVDVPLVPPALLRTWAAAVLESAGSGASYLLVQERAQPAFCMVRRSGLVLIQAALDSGERRLNALLESVQDESGVCGTLQWEAASALSDEGVDTADGDALARWFSNVNTPEDLICAERDRKSSK